MKLLKYIALSLLIFSCKTTDLQKHKTLDEVKADIVENAKKDVKSGVSKETEVSQNEVKELVALLQNLNIGYNGKELGDKLDFLLKKTADGTKLTIQGKGTATYTETTKKEFESLKMDIFKRQDSLYSLQAQTMNELRADFYKFYKQKDKKVEVTGFQFGFYLWLLLLVVILVVLGWISKRFKLFDRFK